MLQLPRNANLSRFYATDLSAPHGQSLILARLTIAVLTYHPGTSQVRWLPPKLAAVIITRLKNNKVSSCVAMGCSAVSHRGAIFIARVGIVSERGKLHITIHTGHIYGYGRIAVVMKFNHKLA